jgi:hypothetical protein
MKEKLLMILLMFCWVTTLWAQEKKTVLEPDSTFSLPPLTSRGTIAHFPYLYHLYSPFGEWALHPGLNGSLSASAIFGLGEHAQSGFANSAAFMYADNLAPKLSFAMGGYSSFLDYGSHQMKDTGLTAMLNYQWNSHWDTAIFLQKSLMQPRVSPEMWWMQDIGDKIGASVRYTPAPGFSLHLSVWNQRQPYIKR